MYSLTGMDTQKAEEAYQLITSNYMQLARTRSTLTPDQQGFLEGLGKSIKVLAEAMPIRHPLKIKAVVIDSTAIDILRDVDTLFKFHIRKAADFLEETDKKSISMSRELQLKGLKILDFLDAGIQKINSLSSLESHIKSEQNILLAAPMPRDLQLELKPEYWETCRSIQAIICVNEDEKLRCERYVKTVSNSHLLSPHRTVENEEKRPLFLGRTTEIYLADCISKARGEGLQKLNEAIEKIEKLDRIFLKVNGHRYLDIGKAVIVKGNYKASFEEYNERMNKIEAMLQSPSISSQLETVKKHCEDMHDVMKQIFQYPFEMREKEAAVKENYVSIDAEDRVVEIICFSDEETERVKGLRLNKPIKGQHRPFWSESTTMICIPTAETQIYSATEGIAMNKLGRERSNTLALKLEEIFPTPHEE